jgi:hypothetical protein
MEKTRSEWCARDVEDDQDSGGFSQDGVILGGFSGPGAFGIGQASGVKVLGGLCIIHRRFRMKPKDVKCVSSCMHRDVRLCGMTRGCV